MAALYLLLVLVVAASAEPKLTAIPGFPIDYSGQIEIAIAGNKPLERSVVVDVKGQRERVDLDDNTYTVTLYKQNRTYLLTHIAGQGTRAECIYYPTIGAVNGSVVFPSVQSSEVVSTQAMFNGHLCEEVQGVACLQVNAEPVDPTKESGTPFCSNFTYYALLPRLVPLHFAMANPANPATTIVLVDYVNVNYTVDETVFEIPSASSCSPYVFCNVSCSLPKVTKILDIPFCNVALIPSWLLAVAIGLSGAYYISTKFAKGVVGRVSYSISFGTYAFMISSGFVVHCVFLGECGVPMSDAHAYNIWMNIDAGLTSCIAVSFFFNGLIDLRILSEQDNSTYLLMILSYITIFYAYIFTAISTYYLYTILILITCGGYVLMQVIVLIKRKSFAGFKWAVFAGIAGFVGLYFPQHFYCWFCAHFGGWIMEPFWYYLSDLSVALLVVYVAHTRDTTSATSCMHGAEKCKLCLEGSKA